ncbi:hypothetical protein D9758_006014 [Tetrapyrgos nigripes]|uniref:PHD-type domain-containing protein n=1 Tax=Tetrapyrgos nigripes TaxID=182062 RepID=A0A8H5D8U9_9AGAR|nr:hypothetical protein D9758_006014 [Tetrapyrgos nigripes]
MAASNSSSSSSTARSKRKSKEKSSPLPKDQVDVTGINPDPSLDPQPPEEDEEEQGITRCVCGSTGEDDPDAGEFMVQCETCKVWQHGLCMGYESEDQLHEDDYYCEQCRPDLHTDLLKKLSRKARQSSTNSHHTGPPTSSRKSRSHSPSHLKQPSKRRNTMNSAFDENLKQVLEATAPEAGAGHDTGSVTSQGGPNEPEETTEPAPSTNNRKKRKQMDSESISTNTKKRTRSESSTPDQAVLPNIPAEDPTPPVKTTPAPAQPTRGTGRSRRGGGRKAAASTHDSPAIMDPEGQTQAPAPKRGNGRSKAAGGAKRPPQSTISGQASNPHEIITRRGQTNGSGTAPESSRAYRNSHAFVVSQQSFYPSWNLPDYLAHLEEMLPTEVPRRLEIQSSGRGETIEERGVKVKWPSKRMSVIDMNKRVRALVEWVGREQASASDRARRREAEMNGESAASADVSLDKKLSSMTEMEGLMEELINFQERFGPGVKVRDRERRTATTVS